MLTSLEIANFRNLKQIKLTFGQGLNVFYGNNAQGKTNLLEAVYLLGGGRSFRAESDAELIGWGEEASKISAQVPPLKIELEILPTSKKLKVNRQAKRLVDLVGEFSVVLFSPEDLKLVVGTPSQRRTWINSVISRVNKEYLEEIMRYGKLLKNRNRVLLALNRGSGQDLEVWNKQLVELGSSIWLKRKGYLDRLNGFLKKIAPKLGVNAITIVYNPQLAWSEKEDLETSYQRKIHSLEAEEVRRGQTLFGPHRDDFVTNFEEIFEEKIRSKPVGIFGSRGEQRTAVLGLKLAELALIEEEKQTKATLLLDEVLSEFDQTHREMVQKLLYRQQSIVTTTALEFLDKKLLRQAKLFRVEQGVVKEEKP